jgi:hypothetical protein
VWENLAIGLLGALVGALAGAYLGYLGTSRLAGQMAAKRKTELLAYLGKEMDRIRPTLEAYDASRIYYRDPVTLVSPALLTDGNLLSEAGEDGDLLEKLLDLQVATRRHHDLVRLTNMAQCMNFSVPDRLHRQWYDSIEQRVEGLQAAKNGVVSQLTGAQKR